MTDKMLPDDLCALLDDMTLNTPSSSTSSSPMSESPIPTPSQESMSTAERLSKLTYMRNSFCQRIGWLTPQLRDITELEHEPIEAEIEELQDLVDGIDVLIERLKKERREQTKVES